MEKQEFYKDKLINLFESDGRWLKIPGNKGKCVILSDLHNDRDTLNIVVDRFLTNAEGVKIIFCGDYVDRSPSSWLINPTATIDSLLKLKIQYPDRIFLLMGNHDLNPSKHKKFMPCEFWCSLSKQDSHFYTEILESLPIVASTENGVIMTHAVLPSSPAFFDDFNLTGIALQELLWSDYSERQPANIRAVQKQKSYGDFKRSMDAFKCNVLIKGHNPYAPLKMFDNRCITLNATRIYDNVCGRHIAVMNLSKSVNSANDIKLIDLQSNSFS
ncbi:metallophosphoesterase [uncultured Desulfobacter sp.]|uniref:metallophosphoesterase n=1 Tax=uncultured Desulfobacter sp. TaxID=240139 RepID=UPI002AAB0844|nr:metallophosphoesterase [uncultured Desulfobacter sp.]